GESGLDPRALSRFYPFRPGRKFDPRLFELASTRMKLSGLLQSTRYIFDCDKSDVVARQKAIYGKPRLVRLGIGADTEEYILGRASWKTTRLDDMGSSFEVSLLASYIRQTLD